MIASNQKRNIQKKPMEYTGFIPKKFLDQVTNIMSQ